MHDRVHPADGRYYDYLAHGPLTCTSTCHDPHGSSYHRMLRLPYNVDGYGSDYLCLGCHTKVGLVY
jgi:predicted CXXCH cytochrome family protein